MGKNSYEYNTNNRSRTLKIVIIFLLILLCVTIGVYAYFQKNTNPDDEIKDEFFSSLVNNDLPFFFENSVLEELNEKFERSTYKLDSNIKFANTVENSAFSNLDLSKFNFVFNLSNNNSKDYKTSSTTIQYVGNDVLKFDYVSNRYQMAMKSDEVVNRYVGFSKNNLNYIMSNVSGNNSINYNSITTLNNLILNRNNLKLSNIYELLKEGTYKDNIQKYLKTGIFAKNGNIAISQEKETVDVVEYTVQMTGKQFSTMLEKVWKEIEIDDELLDNFLVTSSVSLYGQANPEKVIISEDGKSKAFQAEKNNFSESTIVWEENQGNSVGNQENSTGNQENSVENQENSAGNQENSVENQPSENVTDESQQQPQQPEGVVLNQITQETPPQEEINEPEQQPGEEIPIEDIELPQANQQPENLTAEEIVEELISNEMQEEDTIPEEDNFRFSGYITLNESSAEDLTDLEDVNLDEDIHKLLISLQNVSDNLNWKKILMNGIKLDISKKELLDNLKSIFEKRIEDKSAVVIKTYVKNGKTLKIELTFNKTSEMFSAEIISKDDSEKYLNLIYVKGENEERNGYDINIYKKNTNTKQKYKFSINTITNNKVISKNNLDIEISGASKAKENEIYLNYVSSDNDGTFTINTENVVTFDEMDNMFDLTEENCLFLDNLEQGELMATRDAIKEKTAEILKIKNKRLNVLDLNLASNNKSSSDPETSSTSDTREELKQILIQGISDKMREYLNSGRSFTLQDLEGLQIDGYDIQVSIGSELAVITINGYNFNLDTGFNLSDA